MLWNCARSELLQGDNDGTLSRLACFFPPKSLSIPNIQQPISRADPVCYSKKADGSPTHKFWNCMRKSEVQQWMTMVSHSLQIVCLCWLQPQGHLARSLLCFEEVREAWRRKQGSKVRGLNKQTSLSGSSWRWSNSCRGSERVSDTLCFCFSGKIQHILFRVNNRATAFTYLLVK